MTGADQLHAVFACQGHQICPHQVGIKQADGWSPVNIPSVRGAGVNRVMLEDDLPWFGGGRKIRFQPAVLWRVGAKGVYGGQRHEEGREMNIAGIEGIISSGPGALTRQIRVTHQRPGLADGIPVGRIPFGGIQEIMIAPDRIEWCAFQSLPVDTEKAGVGESGRKIRINNIPDMQE